MADKDCEDLEAEEEDARVAMEDFWLGNPALESYWAREGRIQAAEIERDTARSEHEAHDAWEQRDKAIERCEAAERRADEADRQVDEIEAELSGLTSGRDELEYEIVSASELTPADTDDIKRDIGIHAGLEDEIADLEERLAVALDEAIAAEEDARDACLARDAADKAWDEYDDDWDEDEMEGFSRSRNQADRDELDDELDDLYEKAQEDPEGEAAYDQYEKLRQVWLKAQTHYEAECE